MSAHRDLLDSTLDGTSQRFGFLLMTPFTLKVGLWKYLKQQSFDHSSVFHLAFQNPPGLYCFFFLGLDSFLRNKFPGKNGGGWGWGQGGIDQLVVQLCKISRLTSIVPESARKLWTAKIPNASCRPQLSSAKATTVKAWLHVTWINRDGICCAVLRISDCEPRIR